MAASVPTVYISVPKYVDISTIKNLPKIRPAPSTPCQPMVKTISVMDKNMCNEDSNSSMPKCKKRRLDHLTWEEKIQRKKLKNRVAAQTSRDRKKARMEEMEYEIQSLTEKAEILEKKCDGLQSINDALLEKNRKLDEQVETLREQLSELQQAQIQLKRNKLDISKETVKCSGCETILNGSAVSNGTDPLQQGSTIQIVSHTRKQQLKENSTLAALWKIVALCLLYKTCSSSMKSSTQGNSKSWPKVFLPISQQTWKEVIERSTKLLPKLQAQQSDCLDKWWGPKQSAWNPANIATNSQEMVA